MMPEQTVDRPVPDSILNTWREVDPTAWERLSARRFRAPHRVPGAVYLVVTEFGETIGQALGPNHTQQQVQETYGLLFERAATLAAHRVSCEECAPLINPDGRCYWCGQWPSQHCPECRNYAGTGGEDITCSTCGGPGAEPSPLTGKRGPHRFEADADEPDACRHCLLGPLAHDPA